MNKEESTKQKDDKKNSNDADKIIVFSNLLLEAAKGERIETVELLIDRGAEVDQADNNGGTALIWVACMGHTETICIW